MRLSFQSVIVEIAEGPTRCKAQSKTNSVKLRVVANIASSLIEQPRFLLGGKIVNHAIPDIKEVVTPVQKEKTIHEYPQSRVKMRTHLDLVKACDK